MTRNKHSIDVMPIQLIWSAGLGSKGTPSSVGLPRTLKEKRLYPIKTTTNMATGLDMMVSMLNVKLSATASEVAAVGRINWDTGTQIAIRITESTTQRIMARSR